MQGGTVSKGEKKRQRALDAYSRLQRVASRSAMRVDDVLQRHGLGSSQFGVLSALVERGSTHQQELASTLGRSKAQMTAIIDTLEHRALVRRERQSEDKRFITIHLTDAGRALHDAASPSRDAAIVELMSELSGTQRARLARLCRRLLRTLEPQRTPVDAHDGEHAVAAPIDVVAVAGNN
jgi:MarR family 2-MHQ and catechol resistance regulon transcriptional repressor